MSKKNPEWLAVDADGATVTLTRPVELNGVKQNKVRLRNPTIEELRASEKQHPDDPGGQEIQLFASLADCSPGDVGRLTVRDYTRVQTGYFRLVSEGDEAGAAADSKALAGTGNSAV